MTPKEVNEKFTIKNRDVILKNGNGNTEPVQEILEVEGNFDKIVYNENGSLRVIFIMSNLLNPIQILKRLLTMKFV